MLRRRWLHGRNNWREMPSAQFGNSSSDPKNDLTGVVTLVHAGMSGRGFSQLESPVDQRLDDACDGEREDCHEVGAVMGRVVALSQGDPVADNATVRREGRH